MVQHLFIFWNLHSSLALWNNNNLPNRLLIGFSKICKSAFLKNYGFLRRFFNAQVMIDDYKCRNSSFVAEVVRNPQGVKSCGTIVVRTLLCICIYCYPKHYFGFIWFGFVNHIFWSVLYLVSEFFERYDSFKQYVSKIYDNVIMKSLRNVF